MAGVAIQANRSLQPRRGRAHRSVAVTNQLKLSLPSFLKFNSLNKGMSRETRKTELLDLIKPLQRGLAANEEQKRAVEQAAQELEKLNPNAKTVTSPLLNGRWKLLYTTSDSILKTKSVSFLRPSGPIYQILDNTTLTARNVETAPFYNQVFAEISPQSDIKVAVQFKEFKLLGLIPIKAPASARGELAITYLDNDLRVSRGDKGNLFVLEMDNRDVKP